MTVSVWVGAIDRNYLIYFVNENQIKRSKAAKKKEKKTIYSCMAASKGKFIFYLIYFEFEAN